jgi:hydroxymethylglutaryl-CoA lyase
MQGINDFIPTHLKVEYLNALLNCGFDRLDFGSFVSPKAIPQLVDTSEVVGQLIESDTKLLAIIANEKGMEQALSFDRISFLGYPFSISEQFQLRNTNTSIQESKIRLKRMVTEVHSAKRELMLYLSMGFGNPYGDPWSLSLILDYARELHEEFGISHIALSDTIGAATPSVLNEVFELVSEKLPTIEIGVHLHTVPSNASQLIQSAMRAGCQHFDSAMMGIGGCPMATNVLTGNLATETLIAHCVEHQVNTGIDMDAMQYAQEKAASIFNFYH